MPRAKRICPVTGCPHPAQGRYCTTHNTEYENKRGNSNARGYGSAHQRERRHQADKVMQGTATCAKCGQPVRPGQAWDLGHTDDRKGYTGAEHASCNRSDGGRRAHASA